MNLSTRLGLMSGFISMLLITFLYVANPELLIVGYERLTLLVLMAAILYGVLQQRQTNFSPAKIEDLLSDNKQIDVKNDFASFGALLKLGFRIYIIGFFIKFLFIWFLFNYYDPTLVDMVKEAYLKVVEGHKNTSDMELIYRENLESFKQGNFAPSLTNFLGIALELIVGFILSLVFAFFFKRDQPEY